MVNTDEARPGDCALEADSVTSLSPLQSVVLAVLGIAGMAAQTPKIVTSSIGPGVGQRVPDFSGTDQFGRAHTLQSALGANGGMLVFFRPADW
jgi:hypothetical protein